jgi:leucyl aminopeptidase (aminopeptidase T)
MNHKPLSIVAALVLAASCASCDKLKPALPEMGKTEPPAAQGSPSDSDRNAFTQSAQKELDNLRMAISDLQIKATKASQETKAKLQADLDKLEDDFRGAQQRLSDVKGTTAEGWMQLRETFRKSLEQLKESTEKVRKAAE